MIDVVLVHHVQGLTDGVRTFAAGLSGPDVRVHLPDLFAGRTFESIEDGFAEFRRIGRAAVAERLEQALAPLGSELVYAGISLGAGMAQELAQTRAGARGVLLYEACLPVEGEDAVGPWPQGLPVQIHGMADDPFFGQEGDVDAARALVETAGTDTAELFVYPGDRHLFTDSSLPSYDREATALVVERSRSFLDRLS